MTVLLNGPNSVTLTFLSFSTFLTFPTFSTFYCNPNLSSSCFGHSWRCKKAYSQLCPALAKLLLLRDRIPSCDMALSDLSKMPNGTDGKQGPPCSSGDETPTAEDDMGNCSRSIYEVRAVFILGRVHQLTLGWSSNNASTARSSFRSVMSTSLLPSCNSTQHGCSGTYVPACS